MTSVLATKIFLDSKERSSQLEDPGDRLLKRKDLPSMEALHGRGLCLTHFSIEGMTGYASHSSSSGDVSRRESLWLIKDQP